jgi:hypothetical protein
MTAEAEPEKKPTTFRRIRQIHLMAQEQREGDGVDPREEMRTRQRRSSRNKPDYSNQRLASQIFDIISLSSWLSDIGLADFEFVRVLPTERSGRYVIEVRCTHPNLAVDPVSIEQVLRDNKGILRVEIAEAVQRRKAPDFQLRVVPANHANER